MAVTNSCLLTCLDFTILTTYPPYIYNLYARFSNVIVQKWQSNTLRVCAYSATAYAVTTTLSLTRVFVYTVHDTHNTVKTEKNTLYTQVFLHSALYTTVYTLKTVKTKIQRRLEIAWPSNYWTLCTVSTLAKAHCILCTVCGFLLHTF